MEKINKDLYVLFNDEEKEIMNVFENLEKAENEVQKQYDFDNKFKIFKYGIYKILHYQLIENFG